MQQQYKTKTPEKKWDLFVESHGPLWLKGFAIVSFICAI